MPEPVETLENTASTEVEQPVEQADSQQVETTDDVTETTPQESADTVETEPQRIYANKYKSDAELERGYLELQSSYSRTAQRLAELERAAATPKQETSKYTPDQLETWKEGRLREVAQYENQAARLQADGRYDEANRAAALAAESARQIRMIDAELRKMDIQATMRQTTSKAAEQKLVSDAVGVLKQYQNDLVEGNPLYHKASEFLTGYESMGLDPNSPLVQAQAVAMAAQMLGLSARKVEQTTRKELTKTINQALKAGVQAGAGKAAKTASAPDFLKMSDAEFIKYKQSRGWD